MMGVPAYPDEGEKLIINFIMLRAGHFVAESARSKDPQIIFYPSPGSRPVPMVGAVIISTAKPVSGNFSHLVSDDDEHITLVSGTFSFCNAGMYLFSSND